VKLYVVRHGESVLNRNKCFGGWAPTPLTDKGIADAQKAKAELKAIHFDRVYSSDLLRAVQTAQVVLPGCQPEVRENLRELSVGTFEARPVEECARLYGDVCANARKLRDYTAVGGESHQMQVERVGGFLRMLAETAQEDETVAAFCHAGTLQTMLDCVLHADTSDRSAIAHNGSVSHFRWSNGHWQLVCWNRTESI